ncbi:hypothetical protein L1049_010655 [Liquidambar formosana]|uniref:Cystatin domain-containing protein n=1 Tax=Liquidambar formosana TaxID=63359 RepID=A0AAP0R287_LIQFO
MSALSTNLETTQLLSLRAKIRRRSTVTMRSQHCLLLFLPLLALFPLFDGVSSAVVGGRQVGLVGGWQPIKNISDPHVREIGEFAVTEYDKKAKAELKFESVVKGEYQVVAGMNYRLVVAAKDGGVSAKYEAVVWEKAWENFKNLTSFKRV